MSEPLLRLLSQRGEQLAVVSLPWVAPIYRAMAHLPQLAVIEAPFAHGGLQWHARRALAQRIRQGEWGRFERAYVLPNSLKSAWIPYFAGIPERIGYTGELRYGLLTQRLRNPPRHARGSMVQHYLALGLATNTKVSQETADASGDRAQAVWEQSPTQLVRPSAQPRLFAPPASRPLSDDEWQSEALRAPYTVVAPGAEFGSAKRWPAQHFAQLIAQWPHPAVLLGSRKETELCEAIRQQALQQAPRAQVLNLAGRTSLEQAIELIAQAHSVVSNDSGLMHVAAALGVPQVAIFGSSDPRHTPPLNPLAQVLWLKNQQAISCSPCFERTCPLTGAAHLRCLTAIEPAQVELALNTATRR